MAFSRILCLVFSFCIALIVGQEYTGHICMHDHDSLQNDDEQVSLKQHYQQHPFLGNSLHGKDDSWAPIRIKTDFFAFQTADSAFDAYAHLLLSNALSLLSSTISVVPLSSNLLLRRGTCGDVTIPDSYSAAGASKTDLVLFITGLATEGNTVAYAQQCQFDQFDRPIAGRINLGPPKKAKDFTDPEVIEMDTRVLIHEILHALGFSKNSFSKYRDFSGNKYSTMQIFSERGTTVSKLVTPTALRVARDYFGCPTLNGVELELLGGVGTAGSHLEERLFFDSLIRGVTVPGTEEGLHVVTLAVLEDSGWYRVNYSKADRTMWGRKAGCPFVEERCVVNGKSRYPKHFCTEDVLGCTLQRNYKALCDLADFDTDLPPEFQYFPDKPKHGGRIAVLEYCPAYFGVSINKQGLQKCSNAKKNPPAASNYWGESFGQNSKCISSTLEDQSFSRYSPTQGIGCYQVECGTGSNFRIRVGDSRWVSCTSEGQAFTVTGFRGKIYCPSYDSVCDSQNPTPSTPSASPTEGLAPTPTRPATPTATVPPTSAPSNQPVSLGPTTANPTGAPGTCAAYTTCDLCTDSWNCVWCSIGVNGSCVDGSFFGELSKECNLWQFKQCYWDGYWTMIISICIAVGVFILIIIAIVLCCCYCRRRRDFHRPIDREEMDAFLNFSDGNRIVNSLERTNVERVH